MEILVTGAEGMVGSVLCPELRRRRHEVIPTDLRPPTMTTLELDVCDGRAVDPMVETMSPELVIQLAAELA